ncbi:hypothetical protein OMP38_03915 [Cohnella ginsengisoli]|uniref:Glycosyl hydrolases family 39 N-terminal catalytic domain-containing protein n=1 Tax=Cohnella ginsengisoli TaxID=425004 RepID=A0A9X4KDM8_9BACL|nr:hypothetical protein [Cohnella ginsengisoli]MDG0790093.1 hypothetical protein [Cohnella ginsengisoli]
MKKIRVAFLTCFTAIMLVIALPFSTYASPTGSTWTVNVAAPYNISTNSKYSDSAVWDFSSFWATAAADAMPANYYAKNYPEIKTVQVFGATGGCYTGFAQICGPARDPFINPANTATMTDYDFSVIIHGLRNIVRQGLKPYLKTGNVPVKYSTGATIGAFGLNVRPPDDYNVYYNYIKAMATAFVNEFGLSEVRSWRWSVLSEYENSDWFLAADGTAASTKVAYFKLYDYTAKALEDVLGAGQVNIGAHAQGNLGALWDYRELFDHVTSGTNYATGGTGAPIKFASLSFYDLKPGTLGNFTSALSTLRSKLDAVGLNGLPVGIDEGWMLQGGGRQRTPPGKRLLELSVCLRRFAISADDRLQRELGGPLVFEYGWSVCKRQSDKLDTDQSG